MTYLRNTWYMAAWADEVQPGQLLPRTLLDEPLVFFRGSEGQAHALSDRCPHRFAPLSMGTLQADGSVQCKYHGLRFGAKGECVHNPHGDGRIPSAARVQTYPLVERHSVLWIWMGDAGQADPALIPDFSCMDAEHWAVGKGYLHARANYVLETDNIMDLSHIEFLHPGTLGGDGVKSALTDVKQVGNTVYSMRQTVAEIMPDFLYQAMGFEPGTLVDRWIDVRWDAPATMLLDAGATLTGRPRGEGKPTPLPHIFTPETEGTTHYWFAICFPRAMGPMAQQVADAQIAGIRAPFESEDLPMLEAQQKSMRGADFWSLKPVLLAGDAGAVRARRVLDQLIAAEQQEAKKLEDRAPV